MAGQAGTAAARENGTVLRARSGFYSVLPDGDDHADASTGTVECRLRGRIKRERQATDLAVIGDRVAFGRLPDGSGVIEEVLPRRTRFSRRQPGPRGTWKEDVLVANVDQVVIVFACADPPPHLRGVDRYLVVAEHNEVAPLLVANKVDLVTEADARRTFGRYEAIGYRVLYTSARTGAGIDALRDALIGRTSVVTGPSGVGKSTLLNAVQPGLRLATADVSAALHKGRHTTVAAELLPLPGDGWVADTPGLRELGLWQIPPEELPWCFPDLRPYLEACGFNDCRHLHEPRCAVLAAVERGEILPDRHDSYRRLAAGADE